jgi:hypothetical protein
MNFQIPSTRMARILIWVIVLMGIPGLLFAVLEYAWIYQNPDFAIPTAQHPWPIQLKHDTAYVGPTIAWLDQFSALVMGIILSAAALLAWHSYSQGKGA